MLVVFPKTLQSILACQPVSILRWFKDNDPAVLEKTKWIFAVKDYIRYRITGEAYAEVTDYSGSSLMNIRDLRFEKELLDEFGLGDLIGFAPALERVHRSGRLGDRRSGGPRPVSGRVPR